MPNCADLEKVSSTGEIPSANVDATLRALGKPEELARVKSTRSAAQHGRDRRRSPLLALCETASIALIFWADIHHHIFLGKTLYLFPRAWISLRVRGLPWKDVG